jgi:hypothetical protein
MAQLLRGLWIGRQRRQVFGPQREKAARQLVCLAHPRHYTAPDRAAQRAAPRRAAFDAADPKFRCIVASQYLDLRDRQDA